MSKVVQFLTKAPDILRKWRVIKISVIGMLSIILWDFKNWIMEAPYATLEGDIQSVVVSVVFVGLISGLFAVVNKADEPHKKDD